MLNRVLLTLITAAVIGVPRPVSIAVNPTVLNAGGSVRVVCTVPRNADNRWLEVGIPFYQSEVRQLDGEDSAVTHTFWFHHVPCDTDSAYCAVIRNTGEYVVSRQMFVVSGCEQ